MIATAAATLVIALIGIPLLVLGGGRGPSGTAATNRPVSTTPTDRSEVLPSAVEDYWALQGTLESVDAEPGWLCPALPSSGYTAIVSDRDMPPEFKVSLPGREPVEVFNRDGGPVCRQPHMLVMIHADGRGPGVTTATAGVVVWPQVTRFEDTCGAGCSFAGGPIEEPIINGQPARLQLHTETGHYDLWWVDTSGTPMYAQTSGLTGERVLELVDSITVDPTTHRATVEPGVLGDLEMFSAQPSVGIWERGYWRSASYELEGSTIRIETSRDTSFDPYARFASAIDYLDLVEVGGRPAVWIPEAGNLLRFTNPDGVRISVEGAASVEEAITLAEQLG
jgi:hypothetical protein